MIVFLAAVGCFAAPKLSERERLEIRKAHQHIAEHRQRLAQHLQ